MSNQTELRESEERERLLAHDLRHSLFALRTGIDLLTQVQQDAGRFDEIHRLLQKEVRAASELLNKLLDGRN